MNLPPLFFSQPADLPESIGIPALAGNFFSAPKLFLELVHCSELLIYIGEAKSAWDGVVCTEALLKFPGCRFMPSEAIKHEAQRVEAVMV